MNLTVSYKSSTHELTLSEESARLFPSIEAEVLQLNVLTTELLPFGSGVPPPPSPQTFDNDKSKKIMKLYESGCKAFQQGNYHDAVKLFSVALEIVMRRVKFDLCQGTFLELALLLSSRADSYLKTGEYIHAFNDADMIVSMMMLSPDNLLRRGVANFFLKNYEDAMADYARGLSLDEENERLKLELEVCKKAIQVECGEL